MRRRARAVPGPGPHLPGFPPSDRGSANAAAAGPTLHAPPTFEPASVACHAAARRCAAAGRTGAGRAARGGAGAGRPDPGARQGRSRLRKLPLALQQEAAGRPVREVPQSRGHRTGPCREKGLSRAHQARALQELPRRSQGAQRQDRAAGRKDVRPQVHQLRAEGQAQGGEVRQMPSAQEEVQPGTVGLLRLPQEGRQAQGRAGREVRGLPQRQVVEGEGRLLRSRQDEVPAEELARRPQGPVRRLSSEGSLQAHADRMQRVSQERRRQEGSSGAVRAEMRGLPHRQGLEDHQVRSRQGHQVPAARQARRQEGQVRGLPHR